jgi:hypothetical protein
MASNSRKRFEEFALKLAVGAVAVGIVGGFINLFTSSVAKEATLRSSLASEQATFRANR